MPDTFFVLIGSSNSFDVLSNDLDGNGGGLTLVSVTASANAAVSVDTQNNRVLYRPNAGYFSPQGMPDTFMYTMQDVDGDQRTGNVSVTVMRSDINGNNVDDFVECQCTDLTLITGIDGTGLGYAPLLLLVQLLLLVMFRRSLAVVAYRRLKT